MKIHLINKEIITTDDGYYPTIDTAVTFHATKVDVVYSGTVISIVTRHIAYYTK